ncbi:MAG: hypothetical protein ACFFH0_08180 [Promethearchaeota archaeon]
MNTERLTLKNPRGWFAAGAEVEKAMAVLSDGAFRLFIYLCLNARRDSGVLENSLTQLAESTGRGKNSTRKYLQEMANAGICRFRFSHNPMGEGCVEINEAFWPYVKTAEESPANKAEEFTAEIKRMLQARPCIRSHLSAADEIQVRNWFDSGISLQLIEQAIQLGCVRKYVSWRNNQTRSLINSLSYFQPIIEELKDQKPDAEYCNYIRYRLGRMENHWKEKYGKAISTEKLEKVQE